MALLTKDMSVSYSVIMFLTVEINHILKQLKITKCERKCNLLPCLSTSPIILFFRRKLMFGNK